MRKMLSPRTIAAMALLAIATSAAACNIPVFRYALERWRSDAYELVIAHAEPLSPQQSAIVRRFQAADGKTNLTVALKQDAEATIPQASLRMAMPTGRTVSHWQGSIEQAAAVSLLDSPVRKELVKRLLAGDSVVWLLLRSNNQVRSDASRDLLDESFEKLSASIRLPEGVGQPGSELHSEVPLLVKFSAIEIDPADKQEQFLIKWLAGFRPQSLKQGEPLLVPVFGRGRALEVIPAGELSPELIEDLTLFLSGACSCQVKEQNPGFDLLLTVDWDTQLFGEHGLRPPAAQPAADRKLTPRTLAIPPGKRK